MPEALAVGGHGCEEIASGINSGSVIARPEDPSVKGNYTYGLIAGAFEPSGSKAAEEAPAYQQAFELDGSWTTARGQASISPTGFLPIRSMLCSIPVSDTAHQFAKDMVLEHERWVVSETT